MKKIIYSAFSLLLLITLLYGCVEDPHPGGGILNAALPSVTMSIEGVTATSVTVKIDVDAENGAPVSECGVCWTTAEDILPTLVNDTLVAGHTKGSFTVTIHDLIPDQPYYLRPFATNSVGTSYTEEKKEIITQDGLGIVHTLEVVDITAISAECGGKIELQGEIDIAERGIILEDLSLASIGIEAKWEIKIAMDTDSFYYTISELQPSTSYYVKAYVKDVLGRLYISNDPDSVKFETPDGLPVLGEVEVLPEYDYAVLMAEIVNTGDAQVEKKGFLFGTTENLESEGDSLQVELDYNGNDLGQFEVTVSDLKPNEIYYVKAYAENSFGVVETEIKYFYTKQDVPCILLYSSVKLEDGKAILTGKLEDVGRTDILEIGVYWYKEGDAEEEKKKYRLTEHLDEENEFTVILEDIIGGTPYYVYAYAENSDGTGYSDEVTFTAPARFTIQSVFPGKSGGFSASYVLDNTVYMVGGDAGSKCTDEFYFYNSLTNSWGDLRSFEKEIKQMTACSDGNLGYIFGGTDHEENVFDCLYSYDGRANKWIEYANLPKARYGAIGTFIYDLKSIFLIGGFNEDHQLTRTIYQYNLTTNQWSTELINFPSDIANGISFEYDGKLYIGLGTTNALWYTDNFSADLATSWTQMEGIPAELGTVSTAVVYNEKAYMINSNGYIWEFDLETYKWNQRGTFPKAGMLDYHMFVVQNTIYILGQSFENKSQFIIYNPMWDPIVN